MMASQRLTIILWFVIVATSFALIKSSHESRVLFIEWQDLLEKARHYDVEWGQLLIERSTLQSYIGLEKIAREELHMVFPVRQQIVIVPESRP